jgi:hypothetical protein
MEPMKIPLFPGWKPCAKCSACCMYVQSNNCCTHTHKDSKLIQEMCNTFTPNMGSPSVFDIGWTWSIYGSAWPCRGGISFERNTQL